jgi:hypothetical protein
VQGNISYFSGGGLDLVLSSGVNSSFNNAANAPAGNGNITGDPRLVNRSLGDLHLTLLSPCIDVVPDWPPSPPLMPLTDDIDGNAWPKDIPGINDQPPPHKQLDMGADERY